MSLIPGNSLFSLVRHSCVANQIVCGDWINEVGDKYDPKKIF